MGGARIALSFLAVLLGLVLTAILMSVWSLFTDTVCGLDSDVVCGLSWLWLGVVVGVLAGTALTGRLFKLGWEWWLLVVAGVLLFPALNVLPGVLMWGIMALWPALAGGLTWSGLGGRPRWRPWIVVAVALLASATTLVSLLL
ncbi:MAG: hypothetical protein ACK5LN_01595 [Propioniciclava sp.]